MKTCISILILLMTANLTYAQKQPSDYKVKASKLILALHEKEKDIIEEVKGYDAQLVHLKSKMNKSMKAVKTKNISIQVGTTVIGVIVGGLAMTPSIKPTPSKVASDLSKIKDPFELIFKAPFLLIDDGLSSGVTEFTNGLIAFENAVKVVGAGAVGYLSGLAITSTSMLYLNQIKNFSKSSLEKEMSLIKKKQDSFDKNAFLNKWVESSANADLLVELSYDDAKNVFQEKFNLARQKSKKAFVFAMDRRAGLDKLAHDEVKGLKEIASLELATVRVIRTFVEAILTVQ